MKRNLVIAGVILIVAIGAFIILNKQKKVENNTASSPPPNAQSVGERIVKDEALKNALNVYARAKQQGTDFANGPCLGVVAPDWVLDIAHNPRQAVDDLAENQCSEFREGKVRHFIELDPDGKLIRAQ